MSKLRLTRVFWIGAAAILVVAALVAIGALLSGSLGETEWKILVTLLALLVAGGTAVAGLTLVERNVLPNVGRAVAGIAAVGFLIVLSATWEGFESDTLTQAAGTAALVVTAVLVVTTQLLLLRDSRLRFLVVGTAVALGLATLLTTLGIWGSDLDDGGWKATAALWILGMLGWLLVPVLQRLDTAPVARASNTIERVIANLDGVEAVVNGDATDGSFVIESSGGGLVVRSPSGAIQLRPGEQLVLRRRAGA